MAIKRGVSLYSYQQSEFFHKLDWKAQLREVATNLNGATGIEIIGEATVPNYPFPPESFFFEWNNEMARWGLEAVTYDCFLDTLQFRDHVMNYREAAEHIKYDMRIAKKMGFKNIRPIQCLEFIDEILPLAEELDIRIVSEVHLPISIKPTLKKPSGLFVAEVTDYIRRTGTKHFGLNPDMGIFQTKPCRIQVEYFLRQYMSPIQAVDACSEILEKWDAVSKDEFDAYMAVKYPKIYEGRDYYFTFPANEVVPEDLFSIAPYIYNIHAKFWHMSEIPGKPGQYEEASIPYYPEAIDILKKIGYDGYINSEFEGQRSRQDGFVEMADDVEEVRRNHEMLKRLIEKPIVSRFL